jgi:glycine/D-amino acid oxidase-like deaminating enzyme
VPVQTVAVIGAGVFGVTAALALQKRGCAVSLFDPGPLPHPLAESTDISKIVRLDYGPDEEYLALMETALEGWRRWNAEWPEALFHETGVAFLTQAPMPPRGFEHESYQLLLKRGHRPARLGADEIRRRFPAWAAGRFVDGYFNPEGGYAESGRVVRRLIDLAQQAGVRLFEGCAFARLHEAGSRVGGVVDARGEVFPADWVVFAAGAWTHHALPFLAPYLRSTGQPVFHLRPADPWLFEPQRFPCFGADIANTGYYGFPINRDSVVKIANHGVGRPAHPGSAAERVVTPEQAAHLREFLRGAFPALADAPIVHTRVCVYGDTWDGHFWIARDPERDGLVVAAGGAGHGFKFAPILGDLIADAVEGAPNPILHKFRWRPEVRPPRSEEAARHQAADGK